MSAKNRSNLDKDLPNFISWFLYENRIRRDQDIYSGLDVVKFINTRTKDQIFISILISRQMRCGKLRSFKLYHYYCRRHRLVSGVCASVENECVGREGCAWRRDDKQPERTGVVAETVVVVWFFPPRHRCAYTTMTTTTTGKSKVGKRSNSPLAGIALLPPRFYTVSPPSFQPPVVIVPLFWKHTYIYTRM